MKIIVMGASGLLGTTLVPILKEKNYKVITHSLKSASDYNVDISKIDASKKFLESIRPQIIVNLIGLTNVDLCEEDNDLAFNLNARTVENIASYVANNDCHLIHISTDQLYDGQGMQKEEDILLKNYYASSKYSGELAARKCSSTILRTNFFGKSICKNRQSLTDWIILSLSNNKKINGFKDVIFNPLRMETIAKIILQIIDLKLQGTYNLGSRCPMSKADFIYKFAELNNLDTQNIERVSVENMSFIKTYRPKNMQMDCSKLESELKIKLPTLENELIKEAKRYVTSR